jgi:hypothetical protein
VSILGPGSSIGLTLRVQFGLERRLIPHGNRTSNRNIRAARVRLITIAPISFRQPANGEKIDKLNS